MNRYFVPTNDIGFPSVKIFCETLGGLWFFLSILQARQRILDAGRRGVSGAYSPTATMPCTSLRVASMTFSELLAPDTLAFVCAFFNFSSQYTFLCMRIAHGRFRFSQTNMEKNVEGKKPGLGSWMRNALLCIFIHCCESNANWRNVEKHFYRIESAKSCMSCENEMDREQQGIRNVCDGVAPSLTHGWDTSNWFCVR